MHFFEEKKWGGVGEKILFFFSSILGLLNAFCLSRSCPITIFLPKRTEWIYHDTHGMWEKLMLWQSEIPKKLTRYCFLLKRHFFSFCFQVCLTYPGYCRDSDVFMADSVLLPDISDFFADVLTFFHDGCYNIKITRGCTAGPEGQRGGRRETRSAERRPEWSHEGPTVHSRVIFKLYHPSWKQSQDTQQKKSSSWRLTVNYRVTSSWPAEHSFVGAGLETGTKLGRA